MKLPKRVDFALHYDLLMWGYVESAALGAPECAVPAMYEVIRNPGDEVDGVWHMAVDDETVEHIGEALIRLENRKPASAQTLRSYYRDRQDPNDGALRQARADLWMVLG